MAKSKNGVVPRAAAVPLLCQGEPHLAAVAHFWMLILDGLVADRCPHEKVKQNEARKPEEDFKAPADCGIELQNAAQSPSSGPGGTDHFRPDEDGHRDNRRQMKPIDLGWFCHLCDPVKR